MPVSAHEIVVHLSRPDYRPLQLKGLARKLGVSASEYSSFREQVKALIRQGRLRQGRNGSLRLAGMPGTITGVYRAHRAGFGFVRPHHAPAQGLADVYVARGDALDAASGDEVVVRIIRRRRRRKPQGRIVQIIERASNQFVGTYFERAGGQYVQVDGEVFHEPIAVADAAAKGVRPHDKVVVQMVRFPSAGRLGEAVVTEVLGPRGAPGVDTLSIIREFDLPDQFPAEAVREARQQARNFDEGNLKGRRDFTAETIVTVDPADAKDFDDAVHVHHRPDGSWELGVHIADVAHFVRPGGALDAEARKRGTSVYLPDRVLPMLPETISNNLASLQQGKVRYTKTVLLQISPEGTVLQADLMRSAIRVTKRLDYETVMHLFTSPERVRRRLTRPVKGLLLRMRELAALLRQRRLQRGFLELDLPEVKLELDAQGRFRSARLAHQDESHQMIEEFMLTANEAVARYLADHDLLFLRRTHPDPDPHKLRAFAEFVRALNYQIERPQSRPDLQSVLTQSASRPDRYAVHYSLLRSMKRAEYSPEQIGHYGIASDCYCHFTSPIRRYPDLVVHRLLDRHWKRGKVAVNEDELVALGEHCTLTERRAADAEAELIKLKILTHLADRVGSKASAIITAVEEFGFFAQLDEFFVEGLVHVTTLKGDYFRFDPDSYSLTGVGTGRTYRLGDRVRVRIAEVDLDRRKLALTLAR